MKIEIDDKGARGGIGYEITVHSDRTEGTLAERLGALREEMSREGYYLDRSRISRINCDGTVILTGPILEKDDRVCTAAD